MDKAVIANITEQQWVLHRTYGNFLIRPCPRPDQSRLSRDQSPPARHSPPPKRYGEGGSPPEAGDGAGYALTEVTARKGAMDLGDKRTL